MDGGTNFAVASGIADAVEVCLFNSAGRETRVEVRDCAIPAGRLGRRQNAPTGLARHERTVAGTLFDVS